MPGDIVLYVNRQSGDVEHSGIVVEKDPVLRVCSKWGVGSEVVHALHMCPYNSDACEFWRVVK